jgi:hypothetical protein
VLIVECCNAHLLACLLTSRCGCGYAQCANKHDQALEVFDKALAGEQAVHGQYGGNTIVIQVCVQDVQTGWPARTT